MTIVALSVGQSKIGAAALNQNGKIVAQVAEVRTPPNVARRHQAIVEQIMAVVEQLGLNQVRRIGISYPEMMEPPARLISNPERLTKLPNPYLDAIVEGLSRQIDLDAIEIEIELLHDAAAAVLGEVSSLGTLPGCKECVFIVWGTGVASGIVHRGALYWRDDVIGMMTGEAGLQVVRQLDGSYAYRPSAQIDALAPGELRLDNRMRGPEVMRRLRQEWITHAKDDGPWADLSRLIGMPPESAELPDINRAARLGSSMAIRAIEEAGREMGTALAPFIHYWLVERQMDFATRVVIGSGVAKLSDGLWPDDQPDHGNVLLASIREALVGGLAQRGLNDYDPTGIVLSSLGYEREFFAFM